MLLGYAVKSTAASAVQFIHNSAKQLFLSLYFPQTIAITGVYTNL